MGDGSVGVLASMRECRAAVAGLDPALLSGADCAAVAEEAARLERAVAALRARAAARAAECGAHRDRGFRDAAEWLSRTSGTSLNEARAAIATADALGAGAASHAFAAGDLSLPQAREIARTAADAPGSEAAMVHAAGRGSLRDLQDEGRKRRTRAMGVGELRARQVAARRFRHWRDERGMVAFSGALLPEVGLPFVHRVEAETARIRRDARAAGSTDTWEAHAADGLAEVLGTTGGDGKRRRDAELVIVADINAWRRGHAHDGEPSHVIGGGPIPVPLAKELATDAFLKAVLHDGVDIHTVAHFGRHIPAHLRTALDLGAAPGFEGAVCADPGCGHRGGLEWDHDNPVANLKGRCWGDHQEKTRRDRQAGLLGPFPDREPDGPDEPGATRGPDPP